MADVCNNTLKSWTRETCQVLILLLIYSRNSFLRVTNFYGTNLADTNVLRLQKLLEEYGNIEYEMDQHIRYVTIINA